MKCTYINLDHATERRAHIEANFALHRKPGWELERFAAIDVRQVEERQIPGKTRAGEKACFLSHRTVIEANAGATAPFFILEDDAVFGRNTCDTLAKFMSVCDNDDWDLLFTDVCVPLMQTMADLVTLRRGLLAAGQVQLLDLSTFVFAGSTAYIVNPRSINKILGCLNAETELNLPYDLFLRKLMFEKKLNGTVIFPFVTSLSTQSGASQIQVENLADLVWDNFRRMVWADRDLAEVMPALEQIDAQYGDEDSRLFGVLFGARISAAFPSK